MEAFFRVSRWPLVLSLLLAGILLWLAFRGVSWQEMVLTVRRGRTGLLALSFFVQSLSYFIRGLRWHILLCTEIFISRMVTFWAMMIGYLGNNFLPARAGELIRSIMIGRSANISRSYALATAVTERMIDMIVLVLICLAMLPFFKEMPGWLADALPIMGGIGVVGIASLFLVPRHEDWLKTWLTRVLLPGSLRAPASQILERFFLGMHIFQHPRRALGFLGLTVAIWLIDAGVAILVALAFNLTLTFIGALFLLAALGLASTIPSTPGSVGIFQFVAVTILVLFNFTRSDALVYIVALQVVVYAVVILWGIVGMWRLDFKGSIVWPLNRQTRKVS